MRTILVLLLLTQFANAGEFDNKYWSVATVELAAIGMDAYTTTAWINPHQGPCSYEASSPMLYGRHPEAGRVAIVMSAEAALSMGVSYLAKKHHSRFWAVPMMTLATTHAFGTAQNFRNCR